MEHTYLRIILILFILALSSCGGGDSGDETPNPTPTEIPNPTPDETPTSPTSETSTVTIPCGPNDTEECIEVPLPCTTGNTGWFGKACENDKIKIPKDRPIYALLVSGYYQNNNLDMFHFYKFAQCLQQKGAYVHYAWWNNLLAPHMKRPLHNSGSKPGIFRIPGDDILGLRGVNANKAIPAEDNQFQQDAEALLNAIHENDPDAHIIIVGHSMGGDAVARLASNISSDIDIALLAPIDPVGNRTCIPDHEGGPLFFCNGAFNFTRYRATHLEWTGNFLIAPFDQRYRVPDKRTFGPNIQYLYHRWQQEFGPPFDYSCPQETNPNLLVPCLSGQPYSEYLFDFNPSRGDPIEAIGETGTNLQSKIVTNPLSGKDVPVLFSNFGGMGDGHGEIVGFRGAVVAFNIDDIFGFDSYPLALEAQGGWPSRENESCYDIVNDPDDLAECDRVKLLREWERDPNYLYKKNYEPWNPGYCMVSRDLCSLLDRIVPDAAANKPPVANAGSDQIVECTDPGETKVFLNGSGSTDPDGTIERFDWKWTGNSATGEEIVAYIPLGTHMFTLTVTDNGGLTDTDTVDVTVQDTTAPILSITLSPNVLSPSNHKMVTITATIQINDSCDDSPTIKLVSIASNEADNGLGDGDTSNDIQGAEFGTDDREFLLRAERSGKGIGRIYTVTYSATDSSGNVTYATAEVTVPHDHGKSK